MTWLLRIGLLALAVVCLFAGRSSAQSMPYYRQNTNPYYQPPLSPYLNFLRGGNAAANYYLGVLPEFRQRSLNAQYGAQLQYMNQRPLEDETPEMNDLLPTLAS